MAKRGPKTKLTPELEAEIVRLIEAGNYAKVAAQAVGISESTYWNWMERGAENEEPYAGFVGAVTRANAKAQADLVCLVRQQAPQDFRAAVEILKRRFGDQWRDKTTTELTGVDGGPIETKTEVSVEHDADRAGKIMEVLERAGLVAPGALGANGSSGNGVHPAHAD